MANILDYLTWRGEQSFAAVPWTPIDALLLANLSYNDLPDAAATEQGALLTDIAADMDFYYGGYGSLRPHPPA